MTVTIAVHVTEPPAPVAVPVYIVVPGGETVIAPLDAAAEPMPTYPMPWFMAKVVALVDVQLKVEVSPVG